MSSVWEVLLEAEDRAAETVNEAVRNGEELLRNKREEANREIQNMQERYANDIKDENEEADLQIADLKKDLEQTEREGKENAIENVHSHQEEIIDLLMKTVLTVDI